MHAIDLGLGHVRMANDGMSNEQRVARSVGRAYGSAAGDPALRAAIARWERVTPEQVAITTGASLALVSTLATLKRPGVVLCPRPYYPAYTAIAAMLGLDVEFYDLERERGWLPAPGALARRVRPDTRAVLWNFPGNPTGSIPSGELVAEVREAIAPFDVVVISDEVYADFVYGEAALADPCAAFGSRSVVRVRSFSKAFGIPGERLGYIVASPERAAAISRAHWSLAMCPPASAQAIGLEILAGEIEARLSALKRALIENRSRAVTMLAQCGAVRVEAPPAGIFCWIEVPGSPVDSRALAQACAAHAGVTVMPGAAFGVHAPIFLRASFAVPHDDVTQGFEALGRFLAMMDAETGRQRKVG